MNQSGKLLTVRAFARIHDWNYAHLVQFLNGSKIPVVLIDHESPPSAGNPRYLTFDQQKEVMDKFPSWAASKQERTLTTWRANAARARKALEDRTANGLAELRKGNAAVREFFDSLERIEKKIDSIIQDLNIKAV
jgi:hypothetical protein